MYLPELKAVNAPLQKQIIDFSGYSVAPVIQDGEMRDMLNLSSDKYPNMSQRGPRGYFTVGGYRIFDERPVECAIVKNGMLAVITQDGRFFYGYENSDSGWTPVEYPGVVLNPDNEHKMVAINKRVCIWPEKVWFDVGGKESGSLGELFVLGSDDDARTITFENDTTTECKMYLDGTYDLSGFTTQDAIDMVFKDASGEYTASSTIKDIYTATYSGQTVSVVVFPADAFLSILPGFPQSGTSTFTGSLKMERFVPDLDFVMESNNRLWGCHDNAICCCKLGDPTNWHYYQGLSVDAFEVEVGTDGPWTGCVAYPTHLLFFKENYIHKVYGNTPTTYQTQQSECYGLEKGSEKSVCVINGTVFYKSKIGIMAYGGTLPEHISTNFGSKQYTNAIAGTDGAKYYVNMQTTKGREQLVFDLNKTIWHKESDMDPAQYIYLTNDTANEEGKNQLLYIRKSDGAICSVTPYVPFEEEETGVPWMAELGSFDEYLENKKIYSKVKMRLKLDEGAELTVKIKFDSGEWKAIRHIYKSDDRAVYVPITPARCDKFFIRLEGKGGCVVESLIREYRERSDR